MIQYTPRRAELPRCRHSTYVRSSQLAVCSTTEALRVDGQEYAVRSPCQRRRKCGHRCSHICGWNTLRWTFMLLTAPLVSRGPWPAIKNCSTVALQHKCQHSESLCNVHRNETLYVYAARERLWTTPMPNASPLSFVCWCHDTIPLQDFANSWWEKTSGLD